jgi:hypothetical protein
MSGLGRRFRERDASIEPGQRPGSQLGGHPLAAWKGSRGMHPLRRIAGVLMLASTTTHLSEWFIFPFSFPLVISTLYGFSFLTIGILLLRRSTRVLLWGAIVPLSAAFLGTGNAILEGYMHPITRWHLFVDLVVGPSCIYLLSQHRATGMRAA